MNRTLPQAFRAAASGLAHALRTQRNLRVQCGVAALVLAGGLALDLSAGELALLVLACGLVVGLELANTALELLTDALWPYRSEAARRVKDTGAAAVVVAAAAAAAVGGLVLGPPLLERLGLTAGWVKPAVTGLAAVVAAVGAGWRAARVERPSRSVVE